MTRLLDYLDQQGLAENTLVVYTSDQGFYLGEHGWYDKRFMYEESLSMPLVMRYPAEIQGGQVLSDLVMNLDFAETFLDYADIAVPDGMQGRSLRELVRGTAQQDWRDAIYYHYYDNPHGWHRVPGHCGIRTRRYKLIHFYIDDRWELFDLEQDPHEIHNVYAAPEYADAVQQLQAKLEQLRLAYGDRDCR